MRLKSTDHPRRKQAAFVFTLVIGLYFVISLVRNLLDFTGLDERTSDIELEVDQLRQENQQLLDQAHRVKSGDFTEVEIRDKLGLVQPGETVILLPQEYLQNSQPRRQPTDHETSPSPQPNWKKWLELFF